MGNYGFLVINLSEVKEVKSDEYEEVLGLKLSKGNNLLVLAQ